jgi:hypothetical protein
MEPRPNCREAIRVAAVRGFADRSQRHFGIPEGSKPALGASGRLSGRHREQAQLLQKRTNRRCTTCFSPLIRPSVSSPAALDLDPPAPIGRLSGGVHPGSGAQRRSTQSNTLHVGRSEADRRAVSPDGYRSEGTPSLQRGAGRLGRDFLVPFVAFDKRDSP